MFFVVDVENLLELPLLLDVTVVVALDDAARHVAVFLPVDLVLASDRGRVSQAYLGGMERIVDFDVPR